MSDLLKRTLMEEEFTCLPLKNRPKRANFGDFTNAALLLCGVLDSSETEESDAWFSGPVGVHDYQQLMEMFAGSDILFPGWIEGWYEESDAREYVTALDAEREAKGLKTPVNNVLIKFRGAKTIRALEIRAICYRPFGRIISSQVTAEGLTIIEIQAHELPERAPEPISVGET